MPRPSATTNDAPAVLVEGASVAYGNDLVLEDVTFSVGRGEVAAIIGPNGSGKTTLLKAILGLVPLAAGSVRLFGQPLEAARHRIGYVPQRFAFDREFPITVGEFMDLAKVRADRTRSVDEALKEVGLMPAVAAKPLGTLSGGQLQRVLIAQAILNEPDILVLDEPSSGIDIVGEAAFYDVIEHLKTAHKTTVLLVSHDISIVSSFVDTVVCVNRKLLCYGPPKTTLTAESLQEIFGHHANLFGHHAQKHGPAKGHEISPHRHDPSH